MECEVIAVAPAAVPTLRRLLCEDPTVTQQGSITAKHIAADCTLKAFCSCGYRGCFSSLRNAENSCYTNFLQSLSPVYGL